MYGELGSTTIKNLVPVGVSKQWRSNVSAFHAKGGARLRGSSMMHACKTRCKRSDSSMRTDSSSCFQGRSPLTSMSSIPMHPGAGDSCAAMAFSECLQRLIKSDSHSLFETVHMINPVTCI